ncbi:YqiJ family protein [Sphingomonas sp. ac-8]|uniref:YqiJ family protein n=1 Tax=Sphingomonas sp. ac-8 TaxID=3242977 RepID=UPI003A8031AF
MFDFLGAPQNIAFTAALLLMLLIGLVQAIGFGVDLDADADFDADMGGDLLSWLGVGRVPLLMLLVVFLGIFGALGLLGEQAALDWTGALVSGWIAAPVAGVVALPLTGLAARGLARVLPQDHSTAIPLDELVGRFASIVIGRAAPGMPARARVEDRYGQPHYVMVEPDNPGQSFEEGEQVLLVRRERDGFRAISRGDHKLPQLGA